MNEMIVAWMRFVALACLVGPALSGPTPGAKWPFPYNWTRFPAAWFGDNETNWESDAQIAEVGALTITFSWSRSNPLPRISHATRLTPRGTALKPSAEGFRHPSRPGNQGKDGGGRTPRHSASATN